MSTVLSPTCKTLPERQPDKFWRFGMERGASATLQSGNLIYLKSLPPMAYNDFTLREIKQKFNLTLVEVAGAFSTIPPKKPSFVLETLLKDNIPLALAINTEKARSELLISPVLVELRNLFNKQISLFSGIEFSVDSRIGLNGVVDFLISRSQEQLVVEAPVVIIVEAKKENLNAAIPQCIAEMIAAQRFNEVQDNPIHPFNGVVTTGSAWKFLQLEETTVTIDLNEYYIPPVEGVLGILAHLING